MKILGVERDTTACNHYRVLQPLYKLKEHDLAEILTIYERDFLDLDFAMERIMLADIVVFQRPADENWLKLIKACQKAGKVIITDYDDDPFETSPLSPAYRFLGTEEATFQWPDGTVDELWKDGDSGFNIEQNIKHIDMFKYNFKKADMVSCTTDVLADTFKKINKNTVVLPNLIDFNMYPKCQYIKSEVRIGWQGGSSHYEDLHMLLQSLPEVLRRCNNAKFVFFGDMRFAGLLKDLPQDQVELHPWVQHATYPYKLSTLNLDIGVCPLVDNAFNRRKSAIKYFEYSVVGAATIASNLPPYSPVIENNRNGIIVENDSTQWTQNMVNLIRDRKLQKKLAKSAYDNVYQNYNADTKAHLWADAYSNILKAPLEV